MMISKILFDNIPRFMSKPQPAAPAIHLQIPLDLNDPRRERRAKRVRRGSNNWFESCGAKRNATQYIVAPETLAD